MGSFNPSEINATNYYEHMKELDALRQERDDLLRQKQQMELLKKQQQLDTTLSTLNTKTASIKTSCDYIVQHQEPILAVLAKKGDDCIAMPKAAAENVQGIVTGVKKIFENSSTAGIGAECNGDGIENFVGCATRTVNEYTKMHSNCLTLIKNLEALSNKDDNVNGAPPAIQIHSCSTKKRRRASSLISDISDSTLLDPFQSSNVSASSPINSNKLMDRIGN